MARGDKNDHSYLRTYTGRQFWPLEPRAEDICIEDIAHALSQQCRWSGHTHVPYSVAEHSVRVARYAPNGVQLMALLHDASEAYLVDLPRPLKYAPWLGAHYRRIEAKLQLVILDKFGVSAADWDMNAHVIHDADNRVLWTEKRDLMSKWDYPASEAAGCGLGENEPLAEEIVPWGATRAEQEFLGMYYELTGARPPITTISMDHVIAESKRISDVRLATDIALADTFTTAQYASHVGLKHAQAAARLRSLAQDGVITRTTIQAPRSTGRGSYLYPTPAWRYTGGSTPSTQGTQATTGTSPTTLATEELYQDGVSPRTVRLQGTSHSADPRARHITAAGAGTTGRRRGAGAKKAVAQSPTTRRAGRGRPATIRTAGVRAGRRRTGA